MSEREREREKERKRERLIEREEIERWEGRETCADEEAIIHEVEVAEEGSVPTQIRQKCVSIILLQDKGPIQILENRNVNLVKDGETERLTLSFST